MQRFIEISSILWNFCKLLTSCLHIDYNYNCHIESNIKNNTSRYYFEGMMCMDVSQKKYGFRWILLLSKGVRGLLLMLFFVSLFISFSNIAITYIIKAFVDIASGTSQRSLLITAFASICVVVLLGLLYIISEILNSHIMSRSIKKIRLIIIDNIFSKPLIKISSIHSGEIITRLTTDTSNISRLLPDLVGQMFVELLTCIFAVVTLFVLNWKMALILLCAVPFLLFSISIFSPILQKRKKADLANEDNNCKYIQEIIGKISLLKAYEMRKRICSHVDDLYRKKAKSNLQLSYAKGFISFLESAFGLSLFIIALGAGAYFVLRKETTVGSLVAMVQLVNYIVGPFSRISMWMSRINEAKVSSQRIGEVLMIEPERDAALLDRPTSADRVAASNVAFRYADNLPLILKDVNIDICKGHVVGIAGPSGSGKSTLIKLLLGLYTPDEGTIWIETDKGVVKDVDLRSVIAYVPSDDFVYNVTIEENIRMADILDPEFMNEVLVRSNCQEILDNNNLDLDYMVGENGCNISLGQAQRIALARAYYKRSPVIIFDEPSANLDAYSKNVLIESIRHFAKENKICILITHDPDLLSCCDYVYRLQDNTLISEDCKGEQELSVNEFLLVQAQGQES